MNDRPRNALRDLLVQSRNFGNENVSVELIDFLFGDIKI
jgi:hypothetical protein